MLDDGDAEQAAVDEAYNNLANAIINLATKANKEALKTAIEFAEGIVNEAEKYVDSTIEGLAELLNKAQTLYADEEAAQDDVSAMTEELLTAASKARLKANKTALQQAVAHAKAVNESLYTAESLKAFAAAYEAANLLLSDDTLSEDDQQQVDTAAAVLEAAIDSLVLIENSGDTENPGGTTEEPGDEETPNADENIDSTKEQNGEITPTGDNAALPAGMVLLALSAGALLVLRRRRHD